MAPAVPYKVLGADQFAWHIPTIQAAGHLPARVSEAGRIPRTYDWRFQLCGLCRFALA